MTKATAKKFRVKVTKDGPYIVTGGVPLAKDIVTLGSDREPERWEKGPSYPHRETYALCRCGASQNKPFCDGAHSSIGFDGTETAAKTGTLDRTEKTVGEEIDLTFSKELCAAARFCHAGDEAWAYAERSSDPEARKKAIHQACACPSGSLTAWDKKTGRMIEPELEPSIGLVENPQEGKSGPIRVKGGIPVESADGTEYEVRNRVTLCRCGQSKNRPFCDGTHVDIGFKSGG
ncbi:MAG: CDGSH iron-sulfur domain-containing protein [Candidatus Aminicenantes bacterium]|nr:CDGSH iron-sulfur domain-containing protein [Candidatus Aminicenantes bacterium]